MSAATSTSSASRLRLRQADGTVEIEELGEARRRLTARPRGGRAGAPAACETSYPLELIQAILEVKGVAWVCDEISRDQDPASLQRFFENDFLPYVAPAELEGKRILDFGCGCGASSMVLARMFPGAEIVGLELSPEYLRIAARRRSFHGYEQVSFRQSPAGTSLPPDLGQFELIVMSAVFEHLLPDERRALMPQLWACLSADGCLLLNQTPHRFFPFESHTTGLPLINYLPDRLAHFVAGRFSPRGLGRESWQALLRKGIRGATEREILRSFGAPESDALPALLAPRQPRYTDRVDVWYAALGPRHRALKAALRELLRVVERLLGTTLVVNLSLAIGKRSAEGRGYGPCAAR